MLLLCLLVCLFLWTQIATESRHRTLHRPICQVIPQKLDFELKVDYPVVLLQALLYQARSREARNPTSGKSP